MANVQAVSPVGQLPNPGGMSHRSPGARSPYGPRSPNHYGSRPNSRVSFSDSAGSARPHSRQNSGGRIPRPPSQRRGSPDGSAGSGRERPPSVRSLQERVEMSEFLSPAVKSAVRRWKRFHEEKVRERFKERRESKKIHVQAVKVEKKKLARTIPIDLLALEWMNQNKVTVDARAYLLEKLLPTLILGVEKLLMEVDKKGLAEETEVNPNFNPINYLAQYLMRNNPRYSNFAEASPYIRGLREVTVELKNHVFSFEDNRLAKVKAEARKRRDEQVKAETKKTKERLARSGRIREHFTDWILDEDNQVETHIIHSALKNFKEVLDELPVVLKKGVEFNDYLKPLDKEKLQAEEFVEYLRKLITKMTPDLFNELMGHMSQCASAYRRAAILEARKEILVALFKNCDHASIGIIDRHRVLGLFKAFYDKQPWVTKRHIRNPRRWPVVELDEVGDDESSLPEDSVFSSRLSSALDDFDSRPGSQADGEIPATEVKDGGTDGEEAGITEGETVVAKEESDKTVKAAEQTPESDTNTEGAVTDADKPEVSQGESPADQLQTSPENTSSEEAHASPEDTPSVEATSTPEETPTEEAQSSPEETPAEETEEKSPEQARVAESSEDTAEQKADGQGEGAAPAIIETAATDGESEATKDVKEAESVPTDQTDAKESSQGDQKDEAQSSQDDSQKLPEQEASETAKEVTESKGEEASKDGEESKPSPEQETTEGEIAPTETVTGDKQEAAEAGKKVENIEPEAVTIQRTPSDGKSEGEVKGNTEETKTDEEQKKDAEKVVRKDGDGEQATTEGSQDVKQEHVETSKHENVETAKQENGETAKQENGEIAGEQKVEGSESQDAEERPEQGEAGADDEAKDGEEQKAQGESDDTEAKDSHPATAATGRTTAVSFDEEALAAKEQKHASGLKSPVKIPSSRSGSVAASAFDQNTLNTSQFVTLIEVFLGDEPPEDVVQAVIGFIQGGYVETEEEKFNRLQKARREEQLAKRKVMMDQLFDKWDNDGSGFLDLDELHSVMSKFKENMEKKIVAKAKAMLDKEDQDHRLSKPEFKRYLEVVCSLLPGGEDNFDPLVEFLMTSVERSYEERIRGQARKKWLAQIQQAAETSGASMEPVYKSVFNSLYKDSDQHGRGKRISANVAMMERNDTAPSRGPTCLRYVASTPDDAHFMINKIMYRDMKGISLTSVDTGKPIHVPRVQNHGNIMFWNPERQEEDRQGSFIVIPLKDHRKRVFGTMGIDTLNDPQEKSIFITHEISFFQGVAKAFSTAFQYVDIRRKTLRIAESAVAWIHRRSPHVQEISVYIVEPDDKEFQLKEKPRTRNRKMAKYLELEDDEADAAKLEDFILRRMLTTDKAGNIKQHDHPTKLERKENLFRDYLFRCVDNSETITADAYGQRHTAFPLRDIEGHCVALIDISIGELKQLPSHENKEVQRMLKLLQFAHKEVSLESEGKETPQKVVLEAEKNSEESRIDIMFDRIMLTDLRNTVGKLNLRAFAELKSYKDPPKVIHDILASVLSLFYLDKAEMGELDEYNNCKQYVNQELIKKIEEFDPTALEAAGAVNRITSRLKDVPHGAVAKHGSLPAQHLYNWAFVCLSLLEHTSKMKKNQKLPMTETPPPGSAMSGGITEQ